MNSKSGIILLAARAGIELTWRYAWAAFVIMATMNRSFPLAEAIGAFCLGALSTRVHWVANRGWRLICIAVFQIIGFAAAALLILYDFTNRVYSLFNIAWVYIFFRQTRDAQEWLLLIVVMIFIVLFWVGGVLWARRSDSYTDVCRRFDLGVTAFFSLFLFKLLLAYKGDIQIHEPFSISLIFPFFIFSLLALGLINHRSHSLKEFMSGFQGVGLIISFSVIVLGFGSACVLWFMPYLGMAADVGYASLKTAAAPLGTMLINILRFLGGHREIQVAASPGGPELNPVSEPVGWEGLSQDWLTLSIAGVVLVLAAVILCVVIWYLAAWIGVLIRSLLFKLDQPPRGQGPSMSLLQGLKQIGLFFCRFWRGVAFFFLGYSSAAQLYSAIGRWGKYSGVPRQDGETPMEYGLRLARRFPRFSRQIRVIVDAYHEEVYAGSRLDAKYFKRAQSALRFLRNPRHWPLRLLSWFYGMNFFPQP